jgi:hypothetical protein
MTDEISSREGQPAEPDGDLTTADLAGANQTRARTVKVESPDETESRPEDLRNEGVRSDINRAGAHGTATAVARERESGPLFSSGEANDLRARWDAIQVGFVDEPRRAVEQADNLVAGTVKRLAEIFADERSKLEGEWNQGENVSTEDLRQALRRYRLFFSRLLSVSVNSNQ